MMAAAEPLQHPEEPQEHVVSTSVSLDLSNRLQRLEDRQKLLSYLVLALICALLVGGCCFFRLLVAVNSNASKHEYTSPTPTQQKRSPLRLLQWPRTLISHRNLQHFWKACLIQGSVVHWSDDQAIGQTFLHEMDYKDGRLTLKQDGFYFLYSKIGLSDSKCVGVNHRMMRRSPRYGDDLKPIELMQSARYHCPKRGDGAETSDVRNSYLGAVFHLYANDSIHVALEGKVQIRSGPAENFFGAFML